MTGLLEKPFVSDDAESVLDEEEQLLAEFAGLYKTLEGKLEAMWAGEIYEPLTEEESKVLVEMGYISYQLSTIEPRLKGMQPQQILLSDSELRLEYGLPPDVTEQALIDTARNAVEKEFASKRKHSATDFKIAVIEAVAKVTSRLSRYTPSNLL